MALMNFRIAPLLDPNMMGGAHPTLTST